MTTQRYHKELAIGNVPSGNASIIQKPQLQSEHRHAAEQSLRSCASFIMTVIATHFVPMSKFPNSFFTRNKNNMSCGAKKTIQMTEKACGYEVTPLGPSLITSTDDTSLYMTDDTIQKLNIMNGTYFRKRE